MQGVLPLLPVFLNAASAFAESSADTPLPLMIFARALAIRFESFGLSWAAFPKPPNTRSLSLLLPLLGVEGLPPFVVGSTLSRALLVAVEAALFARLCAEFLALFIMFLRNPPCALTVRLPARSPSNRRTGVVF